MAICSLSMIGAPTPFACASRLPVGAVAHAGARRPRRLSPAAHSASARRTCWLRERCRCLPSARLGRRPADPCTYDLGVAFDVARIRAAYPALQDGHAYL